jgi:hypothetical protein
MCYTGISENEKTPQAATRGPNGPRGPGAKYKLSPRGKLKERLMNENIIALVDVALAECGGRDIVSSAEMTNMLLDIRLALMVQETTVPA